MKGYIKPLLILLLLIAVCAFFARAYSGSGTLLDYAEQNPEKAYASLPEEPSSEAVSDESAESVPSVSEEVPETETETLPREEQEPAVEPPERTVYKDGFYYEPLSEEIISKIQGISYTENDNISLDDLRYLRILHYGFDGEVREGELICNKAIAQDFAEIFYELYQAEYQIEQVKLIDEFQGDDTASMAANNTSCFNYRVVDGTEKLSKHAYGLAIDINPYYNPYVEYNKDNTGETYISPAGSEFYADRSNEFPYKIGPGDLCYQLFMDRGFTWGGNWNSCKDYQHFQKALPD